MPRAVVHQIRQYHSSMFFCAQSRRNRKVWMQFVHLSCLPRIAPCSGKDVSYRSNRFLLHVVWYAIILIWNYMLQLAAWANAKVSFASALLTNDQLEINSPNATYLANCCLFAFYSPRPLMFANLNSNNTSWKYLKYFAPPRPDCVVFLASLAPPWCFRKATHAHQVHGGCKCHTRHSKVLCVFLRVMLLILSRWSTLTGGRNFRLYST